MPAIAEKYDIDYEDVTAITTKPRTRKRGAATRASAPARWNRMEPLVAHFGEAAVAEPASHPSGKSRIATPKTKPVEAPHQTTKSTTRRAVRHQPFRLTLAAVIMWGTIGILTLLLLGINGATLALSQKNASLVKQIKLTQEVIDNSNKSIAAIQVSPETAQWAVSNGWRIADQTDFDEVPTSSPISTDTGGAQ